MIDGSKRRKRQFWLLNFIIRVILKSAVVINNRKVDTAYRICTNYLKLSLTDTKHS